MRRERKQYRIIGAYDSETTNITDKGEVFAFPILHQLGLLDCPINEVDSENVEDHTKIELFRHSLDLYACLDQLAETEFDYVPVILCHNLSFDMYGLSPWLSRHDVRVLAKSARKPISFTIGDEAGNPALVIWDTLIFTQQSLERMGIDCGYSKAVGEWDYDLVRTPETPLTPDELDYAKKDVYALLAWFGWWIRRNPDIEVDKLALNVVTKTGIVRERRKVRFSAMKGKGQKVSIANYWLYRNRSEAPKSDDELFTMLACTRGGFTFCSNVNASVPFDFTETGKSIYAYDATSQHPAQLVSHVYPVRFHEVEPGTLEIAFNLIGKISHERVLDCWDKPFPVAFNACFEFVNLRPKDCSLFERFGVYPLASARYKTEEQVNLDEDNGDKAAYDEHLSGRSYCDSAVNPRSAFGKLIAADEARLYLTELSAWEVWQAYEWDEVRAVHGYLTGRFSKPTDMDVVSTMQFYKAKNAFKDARKEFYKTGKVKDGTQLRELGIAPAIVDELENGTISSGDVEATYLSLKADLNAIFGINASNEYRRETVLTSSGIEYVGEFGVCNMPKHPKVWYQFGQRIVGWSRIAQICAMLALEPYAKTVINGDTDSIKIVMRDDEAAQASKALEVMGRSIDRGKEKVCRRVKLVYPQLFDELEEIGYYVEEFSVKQFCASWNKAYCMRENGRFSFTLAGIPTRRRESKVSSFIGINGLADRFYGLGWSFAEVCNLFLGYNVTFANDVIRLNARKFPEWGSSVYERVTDYRGVTSNVVEPAALALYPMSKTVNDTLSADNAVNSRYAQANNGNVNVDRMMVCSMGVIDLGGGFFA